MRFELYRSVGEWRWRLRAVNGEIIASGEGYHNREDCCHAVGLLMDTTRQTRFVEVSA
jgi:uncharacterized protein YegP (UPF0339 family)